ncbi:hypothetical protein Tco_0577097, partial [Tanacetum coccineum]
MHSANQRLKLRCKGKRKRSKPDKHDTSSSSGNYTTQAVDADIGPVNDEEPFAEVQVAVQDALLKTELLKTKDMVHKEIYNELSKR